MNSISFGTNPNIFEWSVGLQLSYLSPIFSGHLYECDVEISLYEHALLLLPRSIPMHVSNVYYLATARLKCYKLSNQQDDLEQSILGFTEAILSLLLPLPFPNINQAFHPLMLVMFLHATEFKHPKGVKYSVIYLCYQCRLPDNIHNPFSFSIMSFLIKSIGTPGRIRAWRCGLGHRGDGRPLQ